MHAWQHQVLSHQGLTSRTGTSNTTCTFTSQAKLKKTEDGKMKSSVPNAGITISHQFFFCFQKQKPTIFVMTLNTAFCDNAVLLDWSRNKRKKNKIYWIGAQLLLMTGHSSSLMLLGVTQQTHKLRSQHANGKKWQCFNGNHFSANVLNAKAFKMMIQL